MDGKPIWTHIQSQAIVLYLSFFYWHTWHKKRLLRFVESLLSFRWRSAEIWKRRSLRNWLKCNFILLTGLFDNYTVLCGLKEVILNRISTSPIRIFQFQRQRKTTNLKEKDFIQFRIESPFSEYSCRPRIAGNVFWWRIETLLLTLVTTQEHRGRIGRQPSIAQTKVFTGNIPHRQWSERNKQTVHKTKSKRILILPGQRHRGQSQDRRRLLYCTISGLWSPPFYGKPHGIVLSPGRMLFVQ